MTSWYTKLGAERVARFSPVPECEIYHMPMDTATADDMLAEFLAKRSVTVYKATKRKAKAERPDKLEKCEFEPDNSRIGRQSMGVQTVPDEKVFEALLSGAFELAAKLMLSECELRTEWSCDKYGIGVESIAYRTIGIKQHLQGDVIYVQPVAPRLPIYGCATEPVQLRGNEPVPVEALIAKASKQRVSKDAWKLERTPKQGVRVLCK